MIISFNNDGQLFSVKETIEEIKEGLEETLLLLNEELSRECSWSHDSDLKEYLWNGWFESDYTDSAEADQYFSFLSDQEEYIKEVLQTLQHLTL